MRSTQSLVDSEQHDCKCEIAFVKKERCNILVIFFVYSKKIVPNEDTAESTVAHLWAVSKVVVFLDSTIEKIEWFNQKQSLYQ